MTQMLELVYKNFKTDTINMFKVLKENMVLMSKQIGNLNREIEAIKNGNFRNKRIEKLNWMIRLDMAE